MEPTVARLAGRGPLREGHPAGALRGPPIEPTRAAARRLRGRTGTIVGYLSAHWAGRSKHWIRAGADPAASARPHAVSTVRHCWAVRSWSQPRSQALTTDGTSDPLSCGIVLPRCR